MGVVAWLGLALDAVGCALFAYSLPCHQQQTREKKKEGDTQRETEGYERAGGHGSASVASCREKGGRGRARRKMEREHSGRAARLVACQAEAGVRRGHSSAVHSDDGVRTGCATAAGGGKSTGVAGKHSVRSRGREGERRAEAGALLRLGRDGAGQRAQQGSVERLAGLHSASTAACGKAGQGERGEAARQRPTSASAWYRYGGGLGVTAAPVSAAWLGSDVEGRSAMLLCRPWRRQLRAPRLLLELHSSGDEDAEPSGLL